MKEKLLFFRQKNNFGTKSHYWLGKSPAEIESNLFCKSDKKGECANNFEIILDADKYRQLYPAEFDYLDSKYGDNLIYIVKIRPVGQFNGLFVKVKRESFGAFIFVIPNPFANYFDPYGKIIFGRFFLYPRPLNNYFELIGLGNRSKFQSFIFIFKLILYDWLHS